MTVDWAVRKPSDGKAGQGHFWALPEKATLGGHLSTKRNIEWEATRSSEPLPSGKKVDIHRNEYRLSPSNQHEFLLQRSRSGSWRNRSPVTGTGSSQNPCQTIQNWSSPRQILVFLFQTPISGPHSYHFLCLKIKKYVLYRNGTNSEYTGTLKSNRNSLLSLCYSNSFHDMNIY